MSEEKEQKKLKDYSAVVDDKVPLLIAGVKSNRAQLPEALNELLALEKKTRLAADVQSSLKVVNAVLDLCRECNEWKTMADHITLLCKRRAQLKRVHETIIQRATAWVDDTPDEPTKRQLIDVLRTVSAGKMFVELERARLTRILAEMEERAGKLNEAAEILQEVQVETIGAMTIREKVSILLDQVRLCLSKNDFVRAEIIAKKVSAKALEAEDLQDLKLKYYHLMIQFYHHGSAYLDICKSYKAIYDTPCVQADPAQWREALRCETVYMVLAPFDSDVSDLMHRVKLDKKLAQLPVCKILLELFTTDELMGWPLHTDAEWQRDSIFTDGDAGKKRYADLHKRVVQHNIRTISKYYTRIRMDRLCSLLFLSPDAVEDNLSELVSSGQLFVKIDRPAGIVSFARRQTANSALNAWSSDISSLLTLVEKTTHLINKEYMIAENRAGAAD